VKRNDWLLKRENEAPRSLREGVAYWQRNLPRIERSISF